MTDKGGVNAICQSNYYFRVNFAKVFLKYKNKKDHFTGLEKKNI